MTQRYVLTTALARDETPTKVVMCYPERMQQRCQPAKSPNFGHDRQKGPIHNGKPRPKPMKTYEVAVYRVYGDVHRALIRVEAETPKKAEEKAADLLSDSDPAVEFEFCEPGDQVGDDEYKVKEKQ